MKPIPKLASTWASILGIAGTAFFMSEQQTGGMTKQCVYNYLGSTYTITVSTVELCPLTIEVN